MIFKDILIFFSYLVHLILNYLFFLNILSIFPDTSRNVLFHHAWRVNCTDKNKTYIFSCKTSSEKEKWLSVLRYFY